MINIMTGASMRAAWAQIHMARLRFDGTFRSTLGVTVSATQGHTRLTGERCSSQREQHPVLSGRGKFMIGLSIEASTGQSIFIPTTWRMRNGIRPAVSLFPMIFQAASTRCDHEPKTARTMRSFSFRPARILPTRMWRGSRRRSLTGPTRMFA